MDTIKKLLILSSLVSCACSVTPPVDKMLFVEMDSTVTTVTFINALESRKGKLSIVDYLYYYNGAGVAAGDVNNDGLTDLFFVSNQSKNKLYLNKGNFQFEDISEKAGVEGYSDWNTGVTMADVNGDGLLDFYVCAVGDYLGMEGANELYINNGDETFSEKSAEYGLDFTGHSTQAVFFDYDHDGDLDMYLMNHSKFLSRSYLHVIANLLPDQAAVDYLFRNDEGKFVDVSEASGIRKSGRAYGLGITISDINNDGWEDIYVANDFYVSDFCFLNNHDGTFREEGKKLINHFSQFSRGVDIADMNNDGYEDIMVVDMFPADEATEKNSFHADSWEAYNYKLGFGYDPQFSRNTLQINRGGKGFSDNALIGGVAATDVSWSTLLADYDNDGYKDIFITNGTKARLADLAYLNFVREDSMRYVPQLLDHQLDAAIKRIPEGKVHNYFFKGGENLAFADMSFKWGMQSTTISNGAVYADLDNDGDLDLVINNINEPASIYKNTTNEKTGNGFLAVKLKGQPRNTFGIGAKVYIKTKEGFQVQEIIPTRGFLSSVDPVANFGIGKNEMVDSLIVVWNDQYFQVMTGLEKNQRIQIDYKNAVKGEINISLFFKGSPLFNDVSHQASISYDHKENEYADYIREPLIPFLLSTEGPKIAVGDVNGDGLDDCYIGGAKHQPGVLYVQQKNGVFKIMQQVDFLTDSIYEDVDASFLDVDGDGDLDLYAVSGGNEFYGKMDKQFDRLYRNDGNGSFAYDKEALPDMFANKSCVRSGDFDNDGDLDLFVGGRVVPSNYGQSPRSYILQNDGKGKFTDVTIAISPDLEYVGMVTDASWSDTDQDGDLDLILVGDWMPIRIFLNTNGKLIESEKFLDPKSIISKLNGFWQCISSGDFDKDGDVDFVVGNMGRNTALRKFGDESVVKMYEGNFGLNNARQYVIASNRADGKFYPSASMDELKKQIPPIASVYKTEKYISGKCVDDLFSEMSVVFISNLFVNQFATVYFENKGNNTFSVREMPYEVQDSKMFSIYTEDVDRDGNLDLLVGGNLYASSVYQGNYDANNGVFLRGDGKGNFIPMSMQRSGLNFKGQVRDIKSIETLKGKLYLVTRNKDSLIVLQRSDEMEITKRHEEK